MLEAFTLLCTCNCIVSIMWTLLLKVKINWQQVLEKDLAILGFFIALGRSTKSFLSANGFDAIDDPIEGFVRYSFWSMTFFSSFLSPLKFNIASMVWLTIYLCHSLLQVPYWGQCFILSSTFINKFLSIVCWG